MESPDRKRRKVLKAKKTMPTSCRKQMEILNQSKNVEAPKTTVVTNIPNGHNQKMFSENKENVKVMKTSEQINENACEALERHTALLEQVKHWIRQEICTINCNLFDKKLNELNERIGKTQCRSKHEAIAGELFIKIRRLQKRIKTVLSSQGNCLEPNTLPSNTVCKVTDSVNLSVTQRSVKSQSKRMSSVNHTPFNSSEKASRKINLPSACVEFVSESNDDVMLISVENPNLTTPIASDPTEIRKNTSRNVSSSPNARSEVVPVEKKFDFVIDLTREGLSSYSIESPSFTLKSTSKAVLRSKEIIPVAENGNEGFGSFEHLPPLPEPPAPLPEMADKIQDTLPPQKPELKVKQVLRPSSIALTWNIPKVQAATFPILDNQLKAKPTIRKGPPSSRLHHLRIAPSAEDQAFNTGAFGDHSNSRVQQIGTKPSTRRKKIPVKEKENLQQENTTRRGDGGGYSRVQKSELTGTRPPGMSSSSSDNRKGFNTSFLNQNRTLP